jgi:hypothetical protein
MAKTFTNIELIKEREDILEDDIKYYTYIEEVVDGFGNKFMIDLERQDEIKKYFVVLYKIMPGGMSRCKIHSCNIESDLTLLNEFMIKIYNTTVN